MADTRKIIKIFLASPGDLIEERRAAKVAVDEINSTLANPFGYQVELLGWEDTVSRFGRPQALINVELEHCEYFIGMLWKRWGTPPDNEGIYTSGFEEEFRRSLARRERDGRPEMTLFFKEVDSEFLRDPGDDLKKVLAFRAELVARKFLLFETFAGVSEFEKKLRKCIAEYIHTLRLQEAAEISERQVKPVDSAPGGPKERDPNNALLSEAEREFINTFAAKAADDDPNAVTPADIARLRLLATVVGTAQNDQQPLGVHDANILFAQRNCIPLDYSERHGLVGSGLEYYATENAPLWHWYSKSTHDHLLALFSIRAGTARRRTGALLAMKLIHEPLPATAELGRESYVKWWLREDETASVKVAALGYLSELGAPDDLPLIREGFDRKNYQTNAAAVDAILRISLRQGRQRALEALYEMQPATVSADVLHELFDQRAPFSVGSVIAGLSHQSADVRRLALKLLQDRQALSIEIAEKLTDDNDALIRCEALQQLVQHGRIFSNEEAKKILIRPTRPIGLGFAMGGQRPPTDPAGEACWEIYYARQLAKLDDASLSMLAEEESIYDLEAKFVWAERQYRRDGAELREAIKDGFRKFFAKELARVERHFAAFGGDLLDKTRGLEDYIRKQWMRKAIDVVCRNDDGSDLNLVRDTLKQSNIDFSDTDLAYLERFGDWEDIPLITAIAERPHGTGLSLLAFSSSINEKYRRAAQAMYKIGHERLPELLVTPMPSRLLTYFIVQLRSSAMNSLRDNTLLSLFGHNDALVRKATSLMCVRFLPKRRLEKLLSKYLSRDYWYYNVIHWLDFGVSLPKERVVAGVMRVVEREWGRKTGWS